MTNPESNGFWSFFDGYAAPQLAHREDTFRKTFEYLDRFATPITIVETGCLRKEGNWQGDGQSTVLFDKYVSSRGSDSKVYSVDLDPAAVQLCRTLVSGNVQVTAADSVAYLNTLTKRFAEENIKVNLFYLDSFDLDPTYWFASACHHLKELVSAWRSVDPDTLLVIDDCPIDAQLIQNKEGGFSSLQVSVGGKGRLVAEFARQIGIQPMFSNYQAGWVGF